MRDTGNIARPAGADRRVRRIDVAKAAGVSQSTVSYVMRNTPGIKIRAATRERVLDVAKRLGYQPDFSASSLARGKTDFIGLLLPSHQFTYYHYYWDIVAGIMQASTESPYYFISLGEDQVAKYMQCFHRNSLDAIILVQSRDTEEHLERIRQFKLPIVSVDYMNKLRYPSVSMDYENAVDMAYAFMSGRDRTKIVFVCADRCLQANRRQILRHRSLEERYKGTIRFEHVDYELSPVPESDLASWLSQGDWDGFVVDGVKRGLRIQEAMCQTGRKLGRDFDLAVFCTGEAYLENGIPSEVLVLNANGKEMGKQAWLTMERLLNGDEPSSLDIQIPFMPATGSGGRES